MADNSQTDAVETPKSTEAAVEEGENSAAHKLWMGLLSIGKAVVSGMEYVGEGVADVLGLDDSKFQDVVDTMTEEEWEVAREVDRERRLEDAIMEAQEARDRMESGMAIEGDDTTETTGYAAVESREDVKERVTKEFQMSEMVASTAAPSSYAMAEEDRGNGSTPHDDVATTSATSPFVTTTVHPEDVVVVTTTTISDTAV